LLLALLPLAWLAPVEQAGAVYPPPVQDEGKFFKMETLEKVNKKIRAIYQNYHMDVVIETFAAIPPEVEKKFRAENKLAEDAKLSENERKELFRFWSDARERELGVRGVYILINRKPGHLYVGRDPETRKKAFTSRDRERLLERLLDQFREKEYDAGLVGAVDAIESAFKTNLK
jgi:hypothetical protein